MGMRVRPIILALILVQYARVFIQKLEHQSGRLADWVRELLCRKSNFVVTCDLANKLARITWALTTVVVK